MSEHASSTQFSHMM